MNLSDLRKYRLDLENPPFYNNINNGIALFDLIVSFIGAYILDKTFNLRNTITFCKNKKTIYYLLVIPFGILVHHIIAHIRSFPTKKIFPDEITTLNRKLFSMPLNIYHILLLILIIIIFKSC